MDYPQAVKLLTRWQAMFDLDFVEAPVRIDPVENMIGSEVPRNVRSASMKAFGGKPTPTGSSRAAVGTIFASVSTGSARSVAGIR